MTYLDISDTIYQNKTIITSILIPAVVAIVVVFLNHLFTYKRAKKDLLIAKIEELFLASTNYIKCCTNILIWIQENRAYNSEAGTNIPQNSLLELTESINKMDMILGLYFKNNNFKVEDYFKSEMPIIEIVHNNININKLNWNSKFNISNEHIRTSSIKLRTLCKSLMDEYGHK